jgi:hypothetical protein
MTDTNNKHLPAGTKVFNTDDGEPGTILNGFAIERWERRKFIVMSEIENVD